MSPNPQPEDGQRQKVLCTVCNDPIVGSDWVVCARCEVPVHRACWKYAGSCPVYACGSKETRESIDLLTMSRAPVVIEGAQPPATLQAAEPPKTAEERAAIYLAYDQRRRDLEAQHRELVRQRRQARFYVPGGFFLAPFMFMMILAPHAWHVWFAFLAFFGVLGVFKKIRLYIDAPSEEDVERVRKQLIVFERWCLKLEPPPDSRELKP